MKQDYSFGKTKIYSPVGSKPPERGPIVKPAKKKVEYHFEGLEDTPRRIRYRSKADGFVISAAAPNFGKAIGMFLTVSVPAFVLYFGVTHAGEYSIALWIICGALILFFFLSGLYCMFRRHKLVVSRNDFTLSSGLGFLAFRQKEKLRDLKGAYISRKIRSGPYCGAKAGNNEDMCEVNNEGYMYSKFNYLGVVLLDGSRLNALEGMSQIGLNYVSYALQTAISGRKQ